MARHPYSGHIDLMISFLSALFCNQTNRQHQFSTISNFRAALHLVQRDAPFASTPINVVNKLEQWFQFWVSRLFSLCVVSQQCAQLQRLPTNAHSVPLSISLSPLYSPSYVTGDKPANMIRNFASISISRAYFTCELYVFADSLLSVPPNRINSSNHPTIVII